MSSTQASSFLIPKDSWVLVTGANGLIASHIVDKLLRFGFRVRGTVRNPEKAAWETTMFTEKYGAGRFELVAVPDISVEGAFDEAIKGLPPPRHAPPVALALQPRAGTPCHFFNPIGGSACGFPPPPPWIFESAQSGDHCDRMLTIFGTGMSGALHVASVMGGTEPETLVPAMVASGQQVLKAAAKEPGVKRVVFTSSSTALAFPKPEVEFVIDEKSWNEESIARAWGPAEQRRPLDVYSTIKAETERAMWKFMDEEKPHFGLNTVVSAGSKSVAVDLQTNGNITAPECQFWNHSQRQGAGLS
jgi:NAD(P)-dependent dehydrogenase (short-subunit alcohol dehydrogenase family)